MLRSFKFWRKGSQTQSIRIPHCWNRIFSHTHSPRPGLKPPRFKKDALLVTGFTSEGKADLCKKNIIRFQNIQIRVDGPLREKSPPLYSNRNVDLLMHCTLNEYGRVENYKREGEIGKRGVKKRDGRDFPFHPPFPTPVTKVRACKNINRYTYISHFSLVFP